MSNPAFEQYSQIVTSLACAAKANFQRRILVISGHKSWSMGVAQTALNNTPLQRILWVTNNPPKGRWSIKTMQAHSVLGRETDAVVFDTFSGFDPDAFGAISGTIRGGGLFILLTPELNKWSEFNDPFKERMTVYPSHGKDISDRFLRRLVRIIKEDKTTLLIEQHRAVSDLPSVAHAHHIMPEPFSDRPYRSEDQRKAVEALVKVAKGHRRRPLVLTSDRGRGKSTALGIAAALLLRQGLQHIIVTAPRKLAVEALLKHAAAGLDLPSSYQTELRLGKGRIEFIAPDKLASLPLSADLLLVDEAAAIPNPLLERFLQNYARIAFATTIHGYEGAGRGFAVRFKQTLDQHTRLWKAVHMETPIRWAPNDPLELFTFRALALDADPTADEVAARATVENCHIEHINRDHLANDEATLRELFALLTLAHYQTRPTDLRHLLDGSNLRVTIMRYAGHIIATALTATEGRLDTELAKQIFEGRRRVRGHLLPQTLITHLGLQQAAGLHATRVIRIAVHPAAQHRGLGTLMLQYINEHAAHEGHDYVGSCFGATSDLLGFWRRSGFFPIRVGMTRGTSTGTHSVAILKPLSPLGKSLYSVSRRRFLSHLPQLLCGPLKHLEPHLCSILLRYDTVPRDPQLDEQDWHEIVGFAFALREYESSLVPIWKLTCMALTDPHDYKLIDSLQRDLLITKVIQQKSWKEVAQELGLPGRKAAIDSLRHTIQPLVYHYGKSTITPQW